MINRYNITGDFDYDKDDFCIDEQQCDDGAWVKYEDIKYLLQNPPSNSDYVKLPKLSSLVKELEKTGLLHPEYKDHFIEESRYNCVEVVLDVIKRIAKGREDNASHRPRGLP